MHSSIRNRSASSSVCTASRCHRAPLTGRRRQTGAHSQRRSEAGKSMTFSHRSAAKYSIWKFTSLSATNIHAFTLFFPSLYGWIACFRRLAHFCRSPRRRLWFKRAPSTLGLTSSSHQNFLFSQNFSPSPIAPLAVAQERTLIAAFECTRDEYAI